MRRLTPCVGVLGVLVVLAACSGEPAARGAVSKAQMVAGAPPTTVVALLDQHDAKPVRPDLRLAVYYPRTVGGRQYLVPERHTVPATKAVAAAAVNELLRGRPVFPGSRPPFATASPVRKANA